MQCLVYRSTRRPDTYLLTDRGETFGHIPEALLAHLGRLEFAFDFDLTPERRLARTDGGTVIEHIERDGYYLQLPDREYADS
jgi:uncharacterized protein YcgL (UPF0745 family)